jgi:cupin fold WbuC family metalloprotein
MNVRKINDEVLYADAPVLRVDSRDVSLLKQGAKANARGRMRLCAHKDVDDTLHEMVIALRQGSYIRPHKHVGKVESAHVIEGVVDIVLFDEEGEVTGVLPMGDSASGRPFYYRMSEPLYHTLLIRSDVLVFHETTNGPFRREETIFAPWSPDEGEPTVGAEYLRRVERAAARFLS